MESNTNTSNSNNYSQVQSMVSIYHYIQENLCTVERLQQYKLPFQVLSENIDLQ